MGMMVSLRERQSAARRSKILDAAETLIRETGGTEFSMRTLSDKAEVSQATPYNTFGTKEGLLFELLKRNLAVFMKEALILKEPDPLAQVLEAADNAISIIVRDPVLLRPLYKVMLGISDPTHRPTFMKAALQFYRSALSGAVEQGVIADGAESDALACSLMSQFLGVLNLWVHDVVNDQWFRSQLLYGFILHLKPFAHERSSAYLDGMMVEVTARLSIRKIQPSFFAARKLPGKKHEIKID